MVFLQFRFNQSNVRSCRVLMIDLIFRFILYIILAYRLLVLTIFLIFVCSLHLLASFPDCSWLVKNQDQFINPVYRFFCFLEFIQLPSYLFIELF